VAQGCTDRTGLYHRWLKTSLDRITCRETNALRKQDGLWTMHFIKSGSCMVSLDGCGDSLPVCERKATHFGVRTSWWSGGLAEEALKRGILSTPNTPNLL